MTENNRRESGTGVFRKGQSGNPSGRPRGTPNKATTEVRELCQRLVTDPAYLETLVTDFKKRELPPQIETLIWHYAFGRPVTRLEVGAARTLEDIIASSGSR